MRVVCQQPNYFPWLGYFEQLARADSFVYLDNVQWIRQGRQHRTRLPHFSQSESQEANPQKNWLTVPVHGHGHRERTFREMEIDQSRNWTRQHWDQLEKTYREAPCFKSQLEPLVRPFLEEAHKHRFLIDLCEASVALFWKPLRLGCTVWHASDLEPEGKKSERLVSLCQSLGAKEYYSALGASRYLELPRFRDAGLNVRWQHFRASALNPLRASDYSVLDWVALCPWEEILKPLGSERGSSTVKVTVDGIVTVVDGRIH
jgi:hypothetical protein